jgi:hypothetical protein
MSSASLIFFYFFFGWSIIHMNTVPDDMEQTWIVFPFYQRAIIFVFDSSSQHLQTGVAIHDVAMMFTVYCLQTALSFFFR